MATTTTKKPARKTTTEETQMTDVQLREAVVQLLEREQHGKEQRELERQREEELAVARMSRRRKPP